MVRDRLDIYITSYITTTTPNSYGDTHQRPHNKQTIPTDIHTPTYIHTYRGELIPTGDHIVLANNHTHLPHPQGAPTGGHINNYLLEKSRVIHHAPGERNFHVFYQLLQSKDTELLSQLELSGKAEDYYYLNQVRRRRRRRDIL